MNRYLKSAAAIISAFALGTLAAGKVRAQTAPDAASPQFLGDYTFAASPDCLHSASANCRRKPQSAPMAEAGVGAVRLRGDATAMHVDARHATIADVLTALNAAFDLSYSSWVALDEDISGAYAGSLRRVIARVLDGYDYVIRQDNAKLSLVVFGRRGERAVAAVLPIGRFRPLRERPRPRLFGIENRNGSDPLH